MGAPNLTDDIWLHGYGEEAIVAIINNGKTNEMPAQDGQLTEAQIHVLAAYVWGLSNKPPRAPETCACDAVPAVDPPPRKVIPIAAAGSRGQSACTRRTKKIYPRAVRGMFARWRWAMVFAHAARVLRPALAASGASARRCCSTWRRGASTSSGWCSIRRT